MTGACRKTASAAADEGDPTAADLAALCRKRSETYALLARLYRCEVDGPLLGRLRAARYPAATGNANADEGCRLLASYLSNAHGNALADLALDYARCFVGEGMDSFSAAYPYESVHTSEKRLLMQDARDEVLAVYRSEGVWKSDDWKETEDHVAAEMEFMQILSRRTVEALEAGDEGAAVALLSTQRNFMKDHLVSWTPLLTAEIRRFAKTGFYQGLACLTDGFLDEDLAFLKSVVAEG